MAPVIIEQATAGSRRLAPNSEWARVALAFLATAGLFYVNIMPALVEGLIEGLGFSNREAGLVGSANIYGAAIGALVAVFLVKHIRWRRAALMLLLTLIVLDLVSMLVKLPLVMVGLRLLHGCVGGLLVGIGFAVIARTLAPDRTFGYLLTVQFGLGGFGVMLLPPLVPVYGTSVLFLALIVFNLATLAMLPFLDDYPVAVRSADAPPPAAIRWPPLLAVLFALFLFQAANMGLYAFIIGMGKHYGLGMGFISPTLGAAAWVGIIGSMLVVVMATRYGRRWPLFLGMSLTIVGTALLHWSDQPWAFLLANCGVGITWAFVIPYLLGMCAHFDPVGQMASLGGFASKMGLASGPLLAAMFLGDNRYDLVINAAVIALVVCTVVTMRPAALLDRSA
ncbi:MFS transporter [Kineobactrum sediminis]|uniref:MFS transporter n=1 Tax=Kineobactrum sediminis TaxID=1905677 RepID=A0A2N5Y655_9GAMM|nr:MFS transporter [Kineobactrum sediminis]PLW83874.1 MFS transporter [Kineobactrum sediminis]